MDDELQDKELAEFTDRLLDDRQVSPAVRPPLADTVEWLARTLSPAEPPAELRLRLKHAIAAEWRQEQSPAAGRFLRSLGRSRQRWVWVTAIAALFLLAAVALLLPAEVAEITGTATSSGRILIPAALAVVAGILIAMWIILGRR